MATLSGRAAIVTGAGRGIGRAIALRLAHEGASVLAVDLDEDGARRTADVVRSTRGQAGALRVDVTSQEDRATMVERALAAYGRIDVLVNNAGIMRVAWPDEITEAEWDAVFAVNTKAVFFCCQAVLPTMVAQHG